MKLFPTTKGRTRCAALIFWNRNLLHSDDAHQSFGRKCPIDWLQVFVRVFRNAFDAVDLSDAPGVALRHFPNGCCGWASLFIGRYLASRGIVSIRVNATKGRKHSLSHEWIEVDGIVLDITLDQFSAHYPKARLPTAYAGPRLKIHQTFADIKSEVWDGMIVFDSRTSGKSWHQVYDEVAAIVDAQFSRDFS